MTSKLRGPARITSSIRAATAVLAAGLVLSACGGSSTGESTGSAQVDTTAPMSMGVFAPPTSFDPVLARAAQIYDATYLSPVYDQLLTMDSTLGIAPGLASEWELADDGLSMTMTLRPGVTFHDGSGFDSAVAKANLDRAKSMKGSTVASDMAPVDQVVTDGPDRVRIEFKQPSFSFPYLLASNYSISSMVSGDAIASGADLSRQPAGSGPYTLTTYGQDRVVFTRYDEYWDRENLPDLREATVIAMPDDNARLGALQSNQIQLAAIRPNQNAAYTSLVSSGRFQQAPLGGQTFALSVNNTVPGLDDPRVRKALSLAIDRPSISKALFNDEAPPAYQFQVEGMAGYVPAIDEGDHYDPEQAKKLLAEAGATDLNLTLILNGTQPADAVGTVVMDQLSKVGVNVTSRSYASVDAGPAWRKGEGDLYLTGALLGGDPTVYLNRYMFGPFTIGEFDPAIEAIYRNALGLQMDDPARADAFAELAVRLDESPMHVPVVRVPSQYLAANDVIGMEDMTFSRMGSMPDLRVLGRTG